MSKFNIFIRNKKKDFIYNSLSNNLLEINNEIKCLIESKNYNVIKKNNKLMFEKLQESKMIEVNDEDELAKLKLNRLIKQTLNVLSLTICPTTNCNFACYYCYEKADNKHDMTLQVENDIVDYIKNFENIDQINITWYGGEPLLKYETINRITKEILNLKNISIGKTSYSSNMVTNGYLFTDEIIFSLKNNNINSLQITLDGNKVSHNNIRNIDSYEQTDSFGHIVSNIIKINKLTDVFINVRVNISKENATEFFEVYDFLMKQISFKDRISIYPGFIQNINECQTHDCAFQNKKEKDACLYDLFSIRPKLRERLYPQNKDNICIAQHLNSFLIDPLGDMYKCWVDIGLKEKRLLNVKKRNKINVVLLSKYITDSPFDSASKCLKCSLFPLCGGGCQKFRIENKNCCEMDKSHLIKSLKCIIENS
ncbi:MAG: radical SAM protein [Bacteroidota bacterium]